MRSARAAALLLLPALAWAGVRPRPGGELRLQVPSPPGAALELDPARLPGASDAVLARAAHATLLELDGAGRLRPGLLAALPEPEEGGRVWRLRLTPGLRFHDGHPLGATEVALSLARLAGPTSRHAWLLGLVEGVADVRDGRAAALAGVQVVSELELRVALSRPFPDFPLALAALPAAIVRQRPDGQVEGAGPFAPAPPTAGAVTLTAFAGCAAGRPFLDRVIVAAGDLGRLSGAREGAAAPLLRLGAGSSTAQQAVAPAEVVLALVSTRLGSAAEATRRAVAALDRAELARSARGPAHALGSLLPPPHAPPHPPPQAGPLPPPPSRLVLLLPEGGALRPTAERIQLKLYERGVRVVLEAVPPRTLEARLAARDYDVALAPVWLASRSPALALAQVAAVAGGAGRAAEVLARAASAPGELAALAAELEPGLLAVPLYTVGRRVAAPPELQALELRDDGTVELGDAWLMPSVEAGR